MLAPADQPRLPAGAGVPRPGEPRDLLRQQVPHGLQAERDEGLDESHLGVDVLDLRVRPEPAEPDVFHLAFAFDAEYSLHGAAPFSVGLTVVWQQPLHHTGAASSISTNRSTSSSFLTYLRASPNTDSSFAPHSRVFSRSSMSRSETRNGEPTPTWSPTFGSGSRSIGPRIPKHRTGSGCVKGFRMMLCTLHGDPRHRGPDSEHRGP